MRPRLRDHDPYLMPDGDVCISPAQVELHKRTEFASYAFAVPFLILLGTRKRALRPGEKAGLFILAGGALLVDTKLHWRFRRAKPRHASP